MRTVRLLATFALVALCLTGAALAFYTAPIARPMHVVFVDQRAAYAYTHIPPPSHEKRLINKLNTDAIKARRVVKAWRPSSGYVGERKDALRALKDVFCEVRAMKVLGYHVFLPANGLSPAQERASNAERNCTYDLTNTLLWLV